jgi:hypothetical protein
MPFNNKDFWCMVECVNIDRLVALKPESCEILDVLKASYTTQDISKFYERYSKKANTLSNWMRTKAPSIDSVLREGGLSDTFCFYAVLKGGLRYSRAMFNDGKEVYRLFVEFLAGEADPVESFRKALRLNQSSSSTQLEHETKRLHRLYNMGGYIEEDRGECYDKVDQRLNRILHRLIYKRPLSYLKAHLETIRKVQEEIDTREHTGYRIFCMEDTYEIAKRFIRVSEYKNRGYALGKVTTKRLNRTRKGFSNTDDNGWTIFSF